MGQARAAAWGLVTHARSPGHHPPGGRERLGCSAPLLRGRAKTGRRERAPGKSNAPPPKPLLSPHSSAGTPGPRISGARRPRPRGAARRPRRRKARPPWGPTAAAPVRGAARPAACAGPGGLGALPQARWRLARRETTLVTISDCAFVRRHFFTLLRVDTGRVVIVDGGLGVAQKGAGRARGRSQLDGIQTHALLAAALL